MNNTVSQEKMPRRFFYSTGYAAGGILFLIGAVLMASNAYYAFRLKRYGMFCFFVGAILLSLYVARRSWRLLKREREEEKIL